MAAKRTKKPAVGILVAVGKVRVPRVKVPKAKRVTAPKAPRVTSSPQ